MATHEQQGKLAREFWAVPALWQGPWAVTGMSGNCSFPPFSLGKFQIKPDEVKRALGPFFPRR
jgi:hypothetical protein